MYKLEFGLFGKCDEIKFLTFESALNVAKTMSIFVKSLGWKRKSLLINVDDTYSDVYEEGFISIQRT